VVGKSKMNQFYFTQFKNSMVCSLVVSSFLYPHLYLFSCPSSFLCPSLSLPHTTMPHPSQSHTTPCHAMPHPLGPQLCIDLNNMHHVRTQIRELPDRHNFNQFYEWLEEKAQLGQSAKDIVSRVLSNADDDFDHHIQLIVTDLSQRLTPEIRKGVAKTLSAPETTPDFDVSLNLYFS